MALALMHSMSLVTNEDKLNLNLNHIQRGVILVDGSNTEIVNILKAEIEKYHNIRIEHLGNKRGENVTDCMCYNICKYVYNLCLYMFLVLISLQYENLAYFLENYIGVIDVTTEDNDNINFNIYFSGNIYHSSVILLNLVDDAIARWKMGESGGIETTYVPIRRYIFSNS